MFSSRDIRNTFLNYFKQQGHLIVPSAPIVVKDDPTLMFTNAGMNQFKDVFLGNRQPPALRVADTQKCLRVSGKHNDLEEVGLDTYHHTMFEMLGNWSFGDYFKREAIAWAWELLTKVYRIDPDQLYVTVFGGSPEENLNPDEEAESYWLNYLDKTRILRFSKKDNFWEMGDTGPCGPCSEIHVDIRSPQERKAVPGISLVNQGHPQVIEIWNLVFIQFNRKADGSLETLPARHIDTGMGFERLCMVLQNKKSTYDTDIFQPLIKTAGELTGHVYGTDPKTDVALRVIADHIRAVAFTIADGQLPDREGSGYVVRRILRRAVRYGFNYLGQQQAFIYKLLPVLAEVMGEQFPELKTQQHLITTVIKEEEENFLRTLEKGIARLMAFIEKEKKTRQIPGALAFELFDTYGFPVDLTSLIARENQFSVDLEDFQRHLNEQKERSRKATAREAGDWIILTDSPKTEFLGYDCLEAPVRITRYRRIKIGDKELYQLVFDRTPFYAEGGGQVGDTGYIIAGDEKVEILDTKRENELILHYAGRLPRQPEREFLAVVNRHRREAAVLNHSATHLLHEALQIVLGSHAEQRGSLVHPDYLRFDFSHFGKVTDEQLREIESLVNEKIRQNIPLDEKRQVPLADARKMGAKALFGEKYGDTVRVIRFGSSIELCGGTHVRATGQIGVFKIISESAVAAGIRRIEALTGARALEFINKKLAALKKIEALVKNPDPVAGVEHLVSQNQQLTKEIEKMRAALTEGLKQNLKKNIRHINGISFISGIVNLNSADAIKQLSFQLKNEVKNLFLVLGARVNGKPLLTIMIDDQLVKEKNLHAGTIVRELAKEIHGGGGGQPFYATAGGNYAEGLPLALQKAEEWIAARAENTAEP
ncbi:MAG: alanine--tRNA ligase [Chitinophagales bacterium]|nr:MAG: alanine--tRNA ligase [Chitinophagales bacterium]